MFDDNSLSENEYQIYLYLRKNDISKMTAASIAKELFVGRTMIYRVCKKMGYQTFSEYKYAKTQAKHKQEHLTINLASTLTDSDLSSMNSVILEIMNSKHIYVFATSATSIASQYLSRQLVNLGLHAVHVSDEHELEQRKRTFEHKDLIICISNSGKNERLNKSVKDMEQTLISITKPDSELHKISDWAITFNFEDYRYENPFDRENLFPIFVILQQLLKDLRKSME